MAEVCCSICSTTDPKPPVKGIQSDMPTGWSTVAIAERGQVRRRFLLCRDCTSSVRHTMHALGAKYRDSLETT